MFKLAKKTLVMMTVASMLVISVGSTAMAQEYFEVEEASGAAMIFDFCVVRPVGIVATAIGAVAFVVSLPFSALGENSAAASQKLISEPAAYTFVRPLGEFQFGKR